MTFPTSGTPLAQALHAPDTVEDSDFVISVRQDKVVFVRKSDGGVHYTLHFGIDSREVDVHRTWTGPDGKEQHERLLVLTHEQVGDLFREVARAIWDDFRALPGLLRPLRIGWLGHRKIAIVAGVYPMTPQEIQRAGVVTRRGRRVRIDQDRYRKAVYIPEYLDELIDGPYDSYTLVATRRRRGVMIGLSCRVKHVDGTTRFFWFKLRDLRRHAAAVQAKVGPILDRWINEGTKRAQMEAGHGPAL